VTLWNIRVTIVAVEVKQCVLCVLLSYMLLSAVKNIECFIKMLLLRIYVAGKNKS